MNKKLNIMSLSMEPDLQDKLKDYAKYRKVSVSKVIRDLVEKYLVSEENVVPVILKVPSNLRQDPESLQKWLETKVAAIVKALAT